jgi:REP element-mobilizing transposase RayT
VADHVHLLFVLSKERAIKDVMQEMKQESSKWMKLQGAAFRSFHWQNGYAAFSVGESAVDQVRAYIRRQREHHRKMSFEDELRTLLTKYRVKFDERYLLD